MLCSCSVMKQEVNYKDPQSYDFKKRVWQVNEYEGAIIIAIHGYNDYSESFQIPATFLTKYKISTISFDLRGFGMNEDRGSWFPLSVHIDDVTFFVKEIRKNPSFKELLNQEQSFRDFLKSKIHRRKVSPSLIQSIKDKIRVPIPPSH